MRRLLVLLPALIVGLAAASSAPAKSESWTGPDGKDFRGEPAAIFGPVAVFKTGAKTSRRVPLGSLSAADCVRFQAALDALAPLAPNWGAAKASLTNDVVGALQRVAEKDLTPLDLHTIPEPEVLLLVFVSHNDGPSWAALDAVINGYADLRKKAGDSVEAVFVGLGHNAEQHRRMAVEKNVPFPVTTFHAQQQMTQVKAFAPGKAPSVAAVTRHGVLLQATAGTKYEDFAKFMTDFSQLIVARQRNNPAGWADRLHYLRAVLPVKHKDDTCGPEMIGHPLNLDVLRQHGITRIDAQFEIGPDGRVTSVKVATSDTVTRDFAAILEPALAQSPFVPAVDHGRFVAGTYAFGLDIAP